MDYIPLRMGDSGPGVLDVQQTLAAMGYSVGDLDGEFGTSTLRAVIGFQSDRGLPVDGVVAVNTWLALERHRKARREEPPREPMVTERRPPHPAFPEMPPFAPPIPPPTPMQGAQERLPPTRGEAPGIPLMPPLTWETAPLREPAGGAPPDVSHVSAPLQCGQITHAEPAAAIPAAVEPAVEAAASPPPGWTRVAAEEAVSVLSAEPVAAPVGWTRVGA